MNQLNIGKTINTNVKELKYYINGELIYTQAFTNPGVVVGGSDNEGLQTAIASNLNCQQYFVLKFCKL